MALACEQADPVVESLLTQLRCGCRGGQSAADDEERTLSVHLPDRRSISNHLPQNPRWLPVNAQILVQ
jgi:hypothetical protein